MKLYLFSDADYDDGNAVGVIANSYEQAVKLAKQHAEGFDPAECTENPNVLGKDVGELVILDIGTEPVVFLARGYYRCGLEAAKTN